MKITTKTVTETEVRCKWEERDRVIEMFESQGYRITEKDFLIGQKEEYRIIGQIEASRVSSKGKSELLEAINSFLQRMEDE